MLSWKVWSKCLLTIGYHNNRRHLIASHISTTHSSLFRKNPYLVISIFVLYQKWLMAKGLYGSCCTNWVLFYNVFNLNLHIYLNESKKSNGQSCLPELHSQWEDWNCCSGALTKVKLWCVVNLWIECMTLNYITLVLCSFVFRSLTIKELCSKCYFLIFFALTNTCVSRPL